MKEKKQGKKLPENMQKIKNDTDPFKKNEQKPENRAKAPDTCCQETKRAA